MKIYDRCEKLIGSENITKLNNSTVFVVGLGGVGGTALLALARSGVKKFIIMDRDVVDETNLNRQLLYKYSDIGNSKVEAAKSNLLEIVPDLEIVTINDSFSSELYPLFDRFDFDFMIDAIDDVKAKIDFIKYAQKRNAPYIVSLGMGNKLDPSKVVVTKLNKTTIDPLAKKLRHDLKENNVEISNINVVFSSEIPLMKSLTPASMVMVPSEAGLLICDFAIKSLTNLIQ